LTFFIIFHLSSPEDLSGVNLLPFNELALA
jgi:hypothetical protein